MELLGLPVQSSVLVYGLLAVALLLPLAVWFISRQRSRARLQWAQYSVLSYVLTDTLEAAVLVDARGIVDFVNPAAEKILKYKLRSARGKHFSELFTLVNPVTLESVVWLNAAQGDRPPTIRPCFAQCIGN
jgi:Transcriptional regulator containing PAS, AAA-type ATPase, and DNA-binding domains